MKTRKELLTELADVIAEMAFEARSEDWSAGIFPDPDFADVCEEWEIQIRNAAQLAALPKPAAPEPMEESEDE